MMSSRWPFRSSALFALALVVSGCASSLEEEEEDFSDPRDPVESLNRVTYGFNELIDTAVLKPTAKTYDEVTPVPAKSCVRNFRNHVAEPGRMLGHAVAGDLEETYLSGFRFVVNTFLGAFGCLDSAKDGLGVDKRDTDVGIALRSYSPDVNTFYIFLPLLGPSSGPFDIIGGAASTQSSAFAIDNPSNPYYELDDSCICITAFFILDARAELLPATEIVEQTALDPYAFVRDAYLDRRIILAEEVREKRKSRLLF